MRRGVVVALVLGIVLVAAGVVDLVSLHQRADRIRAAGVVVDASVIDVFPARTFRVVRLGYSYGGRFYQSDLLDIGLQTLPEPGTRLALAVDPERPEDAAFPGFVSGSRWRYWWIPAGILGLNALILAVSLWREDSRRPTARLAIPAKLTHPEPAWPGRADDTVTALVLGPPGSLPREEELPVRRIGDDTYEICCVPFLQLRLTLGDVVRLAAGGYVGETVHASGRVGIAVRCGDPATEVDVRGLADAFPGTVVEAVAEDGALALAAPSADDARRIFGRLREWEGAGTLTYRSVLRSDGPLL